METKSIVIIERRFLTASGWTMRSVTTIADGWLVDGDTKTSEEMRDIVCRHLHSIGIDVSPDRMYAELEALGIKVWHEIVICARRKDL